MNSRAAILGGQLVGYWGKQDRSKVLTNLLTAPIKILTEVPLGISASGLAHDCWVRLKGAELVLGREPFGRTPLFWTEIDQTIWFASHVRLLLPLMPEREINIAGFYGYSCCSYVPTPLTLLGVGVLK